MSAFVGLLFGMYGGIGGSVGGGSFAVGTVGDAHSERAGAGLYDATHSGVVTLVETQATSALILETAVPVVATDNVIAALPTHDPLLSASRGSCAVVG